MTRDDIISTAIEASPLNRGLVGADWIAAPLNEAYVEGHDVVLFDHREPGVFEAHFLCQERRGREAVAFVRRAFAHMFDHGATLIVGLIPACGLGTKYVAYRAGARPVLIQPTPYGPCVLYAVSVEMWKNQLCRS